MQLHIADLLVLEKTAKELLPLPYLIEESFRRLVEGNYTMAEAEKVFPT